MFELNDRVIIRDRRSTDHGRAGTVIATDMSRSYSYQVRIDNDNEAFWYAEHMLTASSVADQPANESPYDFDGGFGIGGLGRHEEKPIIPSVKVLERYERKAAQARTCRRCGQTDVFDGAMFTTLGGNICDDCAG